MPEWIINTLIIVNTCLITLNLVLLLLVLTYVERKKKEEKGGGRPKKNESWYAHLENKLKSERKEKRNGNF